jgi:maltose alpha-D-glucosyltransferase / alpha-amylase
MPTPQPRPEASTLVMSKEPQIAFGDKDRQHLEGEVLPNFLPRQRWFAAKNAPIQSVRINSLGSLPEDEAEHQLSLVSVTLGDGRLQSYFLPLSVRRAEGLRGGALAKVRRGSRVGALTDSAHDEAFARALIAAMRSGASIRSPAGEIRFSATAELRKLAGPLENLGPTRLAGAEQSNVSLVCGDRVVLKIYRRLRRGIQPELEIGRFLTEKARFQKTPAFLGAAEYVSNDGEPTALASAFSFVRSQGDGWSVITSALAGMLKEETLALDPDGPVQPYSYPLDLGATIGRRTAELHRALAIDTSDTAFAPEPITEKDIALSVDRVRNIAKHAFAVLEAAPSPKTEAAAADTTMLKARRDDVFLALDAIACIPPSGAKTRIHGDYHLGQLLVTEGKDVVITDFEGEPQRPLVERREKASPLRDVADMLRSLDYAKKAAVDGAAAPGTTHQGLARPVATTWRDQASRDFLTAYVEAMEGAPNYPDNKTTAAGLLDLFLLKKAFYEISYEAAYRPDWLSIPVRGVLDLLELRGVACANWR